MPGSTFWGSSHCRVLLACFLLAAFAVPLHAHDDWNYEETHTDSREFVSAGSVHVHLKVGDLQIHRGDSNKISVRYTVKSRRESGLKDARVDFDIRGNEATLDFHAPYSSNTQFDVELTIPANTNLDVHEKVGDVEIDSIEGDKDVDLGVGDIRVNSEQTGYRLIHASAGIGDVNANGYGDTSGWLGKTLKYKGDGKYELRAHVGVGDITLGGK
jgi:hypothetical protein